MGRFIAQAALSKLEQLRALREAKWVESVTKPVTKAKSVTKGRPRIYVTQAEKQRAYRERKRARG